MKKIVQNWPSMVVSAVMSLLVILASQSFTDKKEESKEFDKELRTKASIDYVNQQDNSILKQLETQTIQAQQREDLLIKWMESIDTRLGQLQSKSLLSKK